MDQSAQQFSPQPIQLDNSQPGSGSQSAFTAGTGQGPVVQVFDQQTTSGSSTIGMKTRVAVLTLLVIAGLLSGFFLSQFKPLPVKTLVGSPAAQQQK